MDESAQPENLHDAMINIFNPVIRELDECVENARNSQQDVRRQIEALGEEIRQISQMDDPSPTLDLYAKKVTTIKRRITVMFNILQNVQDRLRKIEQSSPAPKTIPPRSADNATAQPDRGVEPTTEANLSVQAQKDPNDVGNLVSDSAS